MSKKMSISLIFMSVIALVLFFFNTGSMAADCPSTTNYACTVGQQGNYTVSIVTPFPKVDLCPGSSVDKCSTYEWSIPKPASHLDLIVERFFSDKIYSSSGESLNCTGQGDPSQGAGNFGRYLTWNCFIKFNNDSTGYIPNPKVTIKGEFTAAPTDWFVKQASDPVYGDFGIIQGPAAVPPPPTPIIAKTNLSFTATKDNGDKFLIEVIKDTSGKIVEIWRTTPGGVRQNITNTGIPIANIKFKYTINNIIVEEGVKYIPDDTTTKTGNESTCGYWYQGYFYNFCF